MSPGYEPRLETQLSLQNFELNLGYDLRLAVARTEYQDETLFIVCFTLPIKLRLKFGFFCSNYTSLSVQYNNKGIYFQ